MNQCEARDSWISGVYVQRHREGHVHFPSVPQNRAQAMSTCMLSQVTCPEVCIHFMPVIWRVWKRFIPPRQLVADTQHRHLGGRFLEGRVQLPQGLYAGLQVEEHMLCVLNCAELYDVFHQRVCHHCTTQGEHFDIPARGPEFNGLVQLLQGFYTGHQIEEACSASSIVQDPMMSSIRMYITTAP